MLYSFLVVYLYFFVSNFHLPFDHKVSEINGSLGEIKIFFILFQYPGRSFVILRSK